LFTHFTETLDQAGKADAIYHLQGMMDRWYAQSADERIDGVTDLGKGGGLPTATEVKDKLKRAGNKLYDAIYEELAGMDRALHDMLGADVKGLEGNKNPYLLAQKTRGTAGRIQAFLEHGIMDDEGNKIGKSLDEVLGGVPDLAMFRVMWKPFVPRSCTSRASI
jgi:hypothetical protein